MNPEGTGGCPACGGDHEWFEHGDTTKKDGHSKSVDARVPLTKKIGGLEKKIDFDLKLDLHPPVETYQVPARLRVFLQSAIDRKASGVVVIYGRGTGKMRDEVLKFLRAEKDLVKSFSEREDLGSCVVLLNKKAGQR